MSQPLRIVTHRYSTAIAGNFDAKRCFLTARELHASQPSSNHSLSITFFGKGCNGTNQRTRLELCIPGEDLHVLSGHDNISYLDSTKGAR
jgi:hypothetical protein